MFNKKRLYWTSQVIGWLVYIIFIGINNILNGIDMGVQVICSLLAIYSIGILVSNGFRLLIIKLNWIQYNIPSLIPRILATNFLAGTIVYFLRILIIEMLILKSYEGLNFNDAFGGIINWTFIFLIWSLLYFLFHFIDNYRREEIKNLKWQAAKNEMELNKLKSQLNPHFIFNSMNSIRALINENPDLAKEAISQLSNVLRNSLLMGKQKLIPLSEEMKLVKDYLGLEKTRFEEKLNIEIDIDPTTMSFLVPPLMLQTLVENGIKHGTSKLPGGGTIEVSTKLIGDNLVIVIYNSGSYKKNEESETGFGLVNTAQRLKLLFGDRASFDIKNENGRVKTILSIPKETTI